MLYGPPNQSRTDKLPARAPTVEQPPERRDGDKQPGPDGDESPPDARDESDVGTVLGFERMLEPSMNGPGPRVGPDAAIGHTDGAPLPERGQPPR